MGKKTGIAAHYEPWSSFGGLSSVFLNLRHCIRVNGYGHTLTALLSGKEPRYSLDGRLCVGPSVCLGRCAEERNLQFNGRPACSLITILNEPVG
jgi:hypothetical protein